MLTRLFLTIAILSCSSFARADLYSCVAPDGRSVLQGEPCKRGKPGEGSSSGNHARREPAHVELNFPAIAKKKCIEAGYDPWAGATFTTCTEDLRQTMYKRICEQTGRTGTRLEACLHNLRAHDDQYGEQAQLDYYCIARDKAFGTPQYKTCAEGIK